MNISLKNCFQDISKPYNTQYFYIFQDHGDYLVLLKINEPTEKTELFELNASNDLGSQTYVIKGSKYEENEIVTPTDKNGAVFWLISVWTFFSSTLVTCVLRNISIA